jgi:hypothetical protein
MKSILKLVFITILFVFSIQIGLAQDADKTVIITVSGSGKTQDDAKQSALRSAIEQAFGAFISSKTEILNDQVISEEIASVANGNIKSFSILNESQLPDGSWGVTLKAVVSVDKLTSFVEAKGIAIEIKGGLFALNIKQQLLNEQSEIKAVSELFGLLHEQMQISFDYIIKSGNPISLDAGSKNWGIPLEVTATTNKNIDFCANYCIKTLKALSLSTQEVASYKSLNKVLFPITVTYNDSTKTFYLRQQMSINILNSFTNHAQFYTRNFTLESGFKETYDGFTGTYQEIGHGYFLYFFTSGRVAGNFSWQSKRTLSEIEQMTGYVIKSGGIRSKLKHGGFVVYEKDGHGLITAIADIGFISDLDRNEAYNACNELVLNGYNDWRLPTIPELELMYKNLKEYGLGGFENDFYWSSTLFKHLNGEYVTRSLNFNNSRMFDDDVEKNPNWYPMRYMRHGVRAVRSF